MKKLLLILFVSASPFTKANTSTGLVLKDTLIQKTDTLNIMISEANYMYYYLEPLQSDASNFSRTSERGVNHVMRLYIYESKNKGCKLIVLLKIQKESALNESSKRAIEIIKQQNYKQADLKEVERELIRITERVD